MATSGRKKAEKKPIRIGKRYEDGSVAPPSYKAATPTGASNRSGVAKKAAVKRLPGYMVKDSASASDFAVEQFYRKKNSRVASQAPGKGTGAPFQQRGRFDGKT